MSFSSYNISELLDKSESQLGKLISQAQAIETLNTIFVSTLEHDLIPNCRVGYYDSGVLTLFAASAAWATRLRYSVPTLLSQLRSLPTWAGLRSIQVKIQTNFHQMIQEKEVDSAPLEPAKLSAENAAQFQALANSFKDKPGFEKLVASLERLAKCGKEDIPR